MRLEPIQITDDAIRSAERVLLESGRRFDEEARKFIKCFDTIDVQAVPGSGKTTALLAKLIIIENWLPFAGNSGILVISHTNAAVNQITGSIGKYCLKLFSYPNYVGTIQSFVDRFLAIPYYADKFEKRPWRIDDDSFVEFFEKRFPPKLLFGLRKTFGGQYDTLVQDYYIDPQGALRRYAKDKKIGLDAETNIYKALLKIKIDLENEGILRFIDAYILANEYIEEYPNIIQLLRQRFRFVFVDEMQDMAKHQNDILEKLFFYNSADDKGFQRIGDVNQAIFNRVQSGREWHLRNNTISLPVSYRLSKPISAAVRPFGTIDYEIKSADSRSNIKPQLIVYDDNTVKDVIPTFAKFVAKLRRENKFPLRPKHIIKAIGWRKEHEDPDRFAIKDYYPDFEPHEHRPRQDYDGLVDYLHFYENNGSRSLRFIRKNILRGLLKILRLENVVDSTGRIYSIANLINEIKFGEDPSLYQDLKSRLFAWSKQVFQGRSDIALRDIKGYLPVFLSHFDGASITPKSRKFIDRKPAKPETKTVPVRPYPKNCYEYDGVTVEVGTVHSAKGQTHAATLYLECFYQGEYESKRLADCFNGKAHGLSGCSKSEIRKKEAIKMAYVGFSRPTHLLCFAVHKDRLNAIKDSKLWEIIDDLIQS